MKITVYSILLPWALFLIIRYLKAHPFTRAGLCSVLIGIYTAFTDDIIYYILEGHIRPSAIQDSSWGWNIVTSDVNLRIFICICFVILGCILLAAGCILDRRKKGTK